MKNAFFVMLSVVLAGMALPVRAAWYWPFGEDEDSPDAKPRLHRLLENANDLITKMELFGSDPKGLYMLNSELGARIYTAPSLVL